MEADDDDDDFDFPDTPTKTSKTDSKPEPEAEQHQQVPPTAYQDGRTSDASTNAAHDGLTVHGQPDSDQQAALDTRQQQAAQQHQNNSCDSAQQNLNKSRHKAVKLAAGCQLTGPRQYQPMYQHAPVYQPPVYLLAPQPAGYHLATLPGRIEPTALDWQPACVDTCVHTAPLGVCSSPAHFHQHHHHHHHHDQLAYFWCLQQNLMRPESVYQQQQLYLTPLYAPAPSYWATATAFVPAFLPEVATYHHYQHQTQPLSAGNLYTSPATPTLQLSGDQSQVKCMNQTVEYLARSLPVCATPAVTRQAYGMDKVWKDEFQIIFSQVASNVTWNLAELETNPVLLDSASIVAYRGHYLIDNQTSQNDDSIPLCDQLAGVDIPSNFNVDEQPPSVHEEQFVGRTVDSSGSNSPHAAELDDQSYDEVKERDLNLVDPDESSLAETHHNHGVQSDSETPLNSDCDEPIALNQNAPTSGPDSGLGSDTNSHHADSKSCKSSNSSAASVLSESSQDSDTSSPQVTLTDTPGSFCSPPLRQPVEGNLQRGSNHGRVPTKFRMFIDSAKVRFCCENCGHGWTSMKGRVVFWYELFEFINEPCWLPANPQNAPVLVGMGQSPAGPMLGPTGTEGQSVNVVIGYCAYKLFGQQCDICKIEDRFERPMWYPEEVTKVLNNLYSKIGQLYFGFKTPAIDKQRRAGKPRTSHNSSLCQACQDGLCTDRK